MDEYRIGDILLLSEKGLNWLGHTVERRLALSCLRFRYRCIARKHPKCITVMRIPSGAYETYHHSFLEKE